MRRAVVLILVVLFALVAGCAEPVKDCPACGGSGSGVRYVQAERKAGLPTMPPMPGAKLVPVSAPCMTCGGDGRR